MKMIKEGTLEINISWKLVHKAALMAYIIIMARKTAANPDAYYFALRVRLSVGCKRRSHFFLYLPDFSYFRL